MEYKQTNIIDTINIYLKNYDILIDNCERFTKGSVNWHNDKKTHLHSCANDTNNYNIFISELEERIFNSNEIDNQKLLNLITIKLNEISKRISKLAFINSFPHLKTESLDYVRFKGGTFLLFMLEFLDLTTFEHLNLTIGRYFDALNKKFEIDKSNILDFFALKMLPIIKDIDLDQLPEYEYKNEVQKIAWLHEIGVLETIISNSKDNGATNWRRAANIIHSFTQINVDIIRKCLMAMYNGNETNKKNNPLNNPVNKLFVIEMAAKFKLNKPS